VRAQIELSAPVQITPRVTQMAGLFDVPVSEKTTLTWDHDLPVEERDWNIGLITGPSGAGKSTLARHLWPGKVITEFEWPDDRSLLDGFPASLGIKEVTGFLTAVGLGSPPAWMRPYRTLSTGEAFRATIARALAGQDDLMVIDEFTSVVDRQIARVASHTTQKAVRKAGRRLVAVTCHYDVTDWLQPDWAYDVAAGEFTWRSVQRHPPLDFAVHECGRSLWPMFARHHYLSGSLQPAATCFAAYADDRPVAFTSCLRFPHPRTRNIMMGHRLVVLPDWQGLGLGGRLDDWLGQYLYERGFRYRNVIAHPAMIRYYAGSPRWQDVTSGRGTLRNSSSNKSLRKRALTSRFLATRSFQYRPPKAA
jgi:ABC-type thiamine transport system ATPase subunit/GNAT superfamily N-acetyltransferase